MPEQNQTPIAPSFSRPSARYDVNGSVMQRGNYGVPPRQPLAQPVSPSVVTAPSSAQPIQDFGPPRPVQTPINTPTAPVAAPPTTVTNSFAQPAAPVAAPQHDNPAPFQAAPAIFEALRQSAKAPDAEEAHRLAVVGAKLWIIGLVIGGLLLIGGAVKWFSAGSIAGERIAVGAVVLNDGHKTTIQFTADDGLLHRFTIQQSSKDQIPGTAVQLAYQPGAAEATVKQVAIVQAAHSQAVGLLVGGFVIAALSGVLKLVQRRFRQPRQRSQAVPVSA